EDLVPGVYELDMFAPPLTGVTATARAALAPVDLAEAGAGGSLEAANPGTATAPGRAVVTLVGGERAFEVTGRGVPAETLTVRVPESAARAVVDVQVPRDEGGVAADLGVTEFGGRGQQGAGGRWWPGRKASRRWWIFASTTRRARDWTRSGGWRRSRDVAPRPAHRADRRRSGLLGRLAGGAVPPGDGRPDRLPDDGLSGRGHDVHPAEAEVARSDARLRHGFSPVDGAHPPGPRCPAHQGDGERGRREPARVRRGRRRGGAAARPRGQAPHRRGDGGRSVGPAGRAARARPRAQEPRHRPLPARGPGPRALRQRVSRRLARRRGAAPGR